MVGIGKVENRRKEHRGIFQTDLLSQYFRGTIIRSNYLSVRSSKLLQLVHLEQYHTLSDSFTLIDTRL